MQADPSSSVAVHVLEYARKGVVKKVKHELTQRGERFEFRWLSLLGPMVLEVDAEEAIIRFARFFKKPPQHVLNNVEKFLKSLEPGGSAPSHKWIDPERAVVRLCPTEDGDAHLELQLNAPDAEYGTKRLFNLANELFHVLQTVDAQYMFEAFGGSPE